MLTRWAKGPLLTFPVKQSSLVHCFFWWRPLGRQCGIFMFNLNKECLVSWRDGGIGVLQREGGVTCKTRSHQSDHRWVWVSTVPLPHCTSLAQHFCPMKYVIKNTTWGFIKLSILPRLLLGNVQSLITEMIVGVAQNAFTMPRCNPSRWEFDHWLLGRCLCPNSLCAHC